MLCGTQSQLLFFRTFLLTTGTPMARCRITLSEWVVIAWLIALGLTARCSTEETGVRQVQAYGVMWRLMEAAIGHEAERRLSGAVELVEVYVSYGFNTSLTPLS